MTARTKGVSREVHEDRASGLVGSELPLLAAWSAIGIGAAITDGNYAPTSISLVMIGAILIVATVALKLIPWPHRYGPVDGGLAVGTVVFSALVFPAGAYGSGGELYASRALTVGAALLLALWSMFQLKRDRLVAYLVVLTMAGAGAAIVLSSPTPPIDVWFMLQAAAHGLSHGHNIYTLRWTSGIPNEVSNQFTYLPGSALLLWPFHAAFGDVRYGLLAALVLTGIVLIRAGAHSGTALIACLYLLYPKTLYGLEQSWIDPLTLCALSLMGYAMMKGRRGWAVVALAVVLSCKQYNWLIIPIAVLWKDFGWRRTALSVGAATALILPWAVADMHAFFTGVIKYNIALPPRLDSLSFYTTALLHGHNPGLELTAVTIVLVVVLSILKLPRNAFGFFLGSAAVFSMYDLFNRLSFYNAWQLAGELALFAVVFGRSSAEYSGAEHGLQHSLRKASVSGHAL